MKQSRCYLATIVTAIVAVAPLAAAPSIAGAASGCGVFDGTVDPGGVCRSHTVTPRYELTISYPVDYPDQQAVTDFVAATRAKWAKISDAQPLRDVPYLPTISGTEYHSGPPQAGTRSLVFALNSDFGAHPVTWFHALNYDVGRNVPITLGTLFKDGVDPVRVLAPIVKRELAKRGLEADVSLDGVVAQDFEQFAITDDAVTFFLAQGLVLPQVDGPRRIAVPRSELASVLA